MNLVRSAVRALAALALAAAPVAAATAASGAAPPSGAVEVSVDGTTWSTATTTPLFDPAVLWVPGDVRTGTLYARTRACDAASGEARATFGQGGPDLAADLRVRTRVDGGPWTSGQTSRGFTVPPGAPTRLDVEVTFDPASGDESQGEGAPLTVTVTVSCDQVAAPGPSPVTPQAGQAGSGLLPRTGIEVARTVLAAAALVVSGVWLVLATRRRAVDDA
ncbi:MAG: hypothetical protein FWF90_10230 [Promicromonosporaceae bacterium]|nr:hypothetical protein [Promicromonosporaceae bacterium]